MARIYSSAELDAMEAEGSAPVGKEYTSAELDEMEGITPPVEPPTKKPLVGNPFNPKSYAPIGEEWQKGMTTVSDLVEQDKPVQSYLQSLGTQTRAMGSSAMAPLGALFPRAAEATRNAIGGAISKGMNTPDIFFGGQTPLQATQKYAQEHPDLSRVLGNLLDIGSVIPTVGIATKVPALALKEGGKRAKAVGTPLLARELDIKSAVDNKFVKDISRETAEASGKLPPWVPTIPNKATYTKEIKDITSTIDDYGLISPTGNFRKSLVKTSKAIQDKAIEYKQAMDMQDYDLMDKTRGELDKLKKVEKLLTPAVSDNISKKGVTGSLIATGIGGIYPLLQGNFGKAAVYAAAALATKHAASQGRLASLLIETGKLAERAAVVGNKKRSLSQMFKRSK